MVWLAACVHVWEGEDGKNEQKKGFSIRQTLFNETM
jgi:hypothetical protein